MHQHIIAQHNSVVGVNDTVYFLGDVSFSGPGLEYLNEMNGTKHLIMGNHDKFDSQLYLKYFKSIHGGFKKHNVFMSHIPIHPSQLNNSRGWKYSIHGHTHSDEITLIDNNGITVPDCRYFGVSMERINFTPLNFDEIKILAKQRWEQYSYALNLPLIHSGPG
jgi:calcineurin-like phosphoesterase family protein